MLIIVTYMDMVVNINGKLSIDKHRYVTLINYFVKLPSHACVSMFTTTLKI